MAMPQRDNLIDEIQKTDLLLEYAVMHGDDAEAERLRAERLENDVTRLVAKITMPVTASFLREQARLLFGRARGDDAYRELTSHAEKYGFILHKGVNNNSKLFGTPMMFQGG